jgi:hypothetical protein
MVYECMVYGVWCMVYGVWCMVYECMVYGVWCMVYGVWYMVYECMVYGEWVYGAWSIVNGAWRIMYTVCSVQCALPFVALSSSGCEMVYSEYSDSASSRPSVSEVSFARVICPVDPVDLPSVDPRVVTGVVCCSFSVGSRLS